MGGAAGGFLIAPLFFLFSHKLSCIMSSLFKLNLPIRSAGWRWVPSLYVFQGLPSCMVMTTSAIFYKDMGISIESFAFWTSLVSLPWSLKPLWAPVVERFGTKRGWTLVMQLLLTILCGALALSLFTGGVFYALSLCIMLLIAFASASHDIACDGYYMLALDQKEQSFFVGIRSTFYRIAMVVATGLIPFVAGRVGAQVSATVGWASAIGGVAVAMLLLLLLCRWGMPAVAENTGRQDNGLQILWRALRSFFTHPDAWRFVLFFLLYRLGEALLCKVVTPFLIEDRGAGGIGMTVDQCGMAYGTVGVIGLVVGGIAGGVLASRYGLRRLLWPMILMMNLPNLLYVAMAHFQPDALCPWVTCGILTEQLGYGFGFTAYMLLLLRYVAHAEYKAAEYAIGTSLMGLSLLLPGMVAGHLLTWVGSYENFFLVASFATLPGMLLAAFIRVKDEE